MSWKSKTPTIILSISITLLACSLFYISFEINKTVNVIRPLIEKALDKNLDLGSLITEIRRVHETIPIVVNEISETRKQIPSILKTADDATRAINKATEEFKNTRPLIPKIISEIGSTRREIPLYLDRAEKIVADARTVGDDTSQGIFSGFIKGIVKTPFSLVGDLGESIIDIFGDEGKKLSTSDKKELEEASFRALKKDKLNTLEFWINKATGRRGDIKIIKKDIKKRCRILKMNVFEKDNKIIESVVTFCKGNNESWVIGK